MERIASFQVDHTKIGKGLYLSRTDGDIFTYDLRFCRPNCGVYLEIEAIHTLEHLLATYLRNTPDSEHIVYVGPMGCRTGFYILTRDLPHPKAISLIQEALAFAADYSGPIPGASEPECGNYLEHNLDKANTAAQSMCWVLRSWTEELLKYPQ